MSTSKNVAPGSSSVKQKTRAKDPLPDPLAGLGLLDLDIDLPPPPRKNEEGVDIKALTFLEKRILENARLMFPVLYPKRYEATSKNTFTISLLYDFHTKPPTEKHPEPDPERGSYKWTACVTWGEDSQPPFNRLFCGDPSRSATEALENLLTASGMVMSSLTKAGMFFVKPEPMRKMREEGGAEKTAWESLNATLTKSGGKAAAP
ncbi:uncharacterized protein LTR77_006803 [Saxophila tyrrhenica]|uniref:Uncharacterized protein n=1 Tax=Saxophila tyrrhenica TaxID=1690608 RepID=A0AAV9P6K3_9PEZI|nr:hypothetical protein LTR77_006803 [Saxophila tyrrhenica]